MGSGIPSVVIDDHKGARLATEHLIAQGYRRIAHIAGQQHQPIFAERLRGYTDALVSAGMTVRPEYIHDGDVSIESGRAAIRHLLQLPEPPDAVFAVEDFTALGALNELKDQGISIPRQFGIIGFANEPFGEHISPGLSTIDQQTVAMGKASFDLLLEMITKTSPQRDRIVLDPVPVFRESSLREKYIRETHIREKHIR